MTSDEHDLMAMDGLLREWARGGPGADERFVARVLSALSAPVAPRKHAWWRALAMAASLAVCAAILWTVISTPQESDIPGLIARLSADSMEAREQAETDLNRLGGRAIPALQEALRKGGDAEFRARAERIIRVAPFVETLGYPAGRDFGLAGDAWAKLDTLLRQPELRLDGESGPRVSGEILAAFAWHQTYDDSLHQRDLFMLRERLVEKRRVPALSWLFVRLLGHSHRYVRLHAVNGLKDLGAKEHASAVAPLLRDPDALVRQVTAQALAAFDGERYSGEIARLLEDPDAHVRMHIVGMLGRRSGAVEIDRIVRLLSDPDARVRAATASALDELEGRPAIEALRVALGAENDRTAQGVLQSALRSLESLRGARRPVTIVKHWSGANSKVEAMEHGRVVNREAWEAIWKRHAPGEKAPDVDFTAAMVIAVFKGRGWNSDGVIPVSVTEDDEAVVVRYDESTYQTAGPGGGGVRVTAFGFIVIPASKKPVVVEDNAQSLLGWPPVWKERARFEGR